jgi:hypothetical protein
MIQKINESAGLKIEEMSTNKDIISKCTSILTVCVDSNMNKKDDDNTVKRKKLRFAPHCLTMSILFFINLINFMDRYTIAGKLKSKTYFHCNILN